MLLWPAFVLSLGLGSGLSLSSHQADDRGWLPSFADWVHLSAASLWIGGLLSLGARRLERPRAPADGVLALLARSPGRWSRSSSRPGVYMTFKRFPALDDLWSVGYGQLLLVKLGLVCLALVVGRVPPPRRPTAARPAGSSPRELLAQPGR